MLIIQRPEVEVGEAEGNTQSFIISPLEPGFGHTLGNSLRRTLLSSIPGAAVTRIRFDEALHEFDTIKGVKEDVTDLILNVKDLVLRCVSEEAVTLRLDARGPGDVTAGDIQVTSDIEILNPQLVIASVNAGGRLALDLTVEQGRGYLSAERAKKQGTDPIGIIPVDAIFSPVRRVAFSVSPPVSSRRPTTTGSRSRSRPTVRSRPATRSRRPATRCATWSASSPTCPTSRAASSWVRPRPRLATSPDLELPIEELDLSERPRNCLKRARVDTIGQLVQKTEDDLLAITNFGSKSLEEVLQKLDERGLSLRVKE